MFTVNYQFVLKGTGGIYIFSMLICLDCSRSFEMISYIVKILFYLLSIFYIFSLINFILIDTSFYL
jgi:hypothetical protein